MELDEVEKQKLDQEDDQASDNEEFQDCQDSSSDAEAPPPVEPEETKNDNQSF